METSSGNFSDNISQSNEVYKKTKDKFKALIKSNDYQGAYELVNSIYNLDSRVKGKYIINFIKGLKASGLTGGEAFGIQDVDIAQSAFKSVGLFIRVVHHEFIHVYQRGVLGFSGSLSIYEVREFLAYHDTLFNKNLPTGSYSEMSGYWKKAQQFYDYIKERPNLIKEYHLQYYEFLYSNKF